MEVDKVAFALQELKITIDEAKNLCLSGRAVHCYHKLQGAQVRCQNVLSLLMQPEKQGENTDVVQTNS